MRKYLILILLILHFSTLSSQVKENIIVPQNPKVGLSLSGGGAKGFAHVGVLKVLDSLGVKVDYISGTSMGAIVGGLYASGYSGKEIEKIVKETDFYNVFNRQNNRADASFFNKSVDKYILKVPIKNGKITLPSSISSGQQNIYLLKELFKNIPNSQKFSNLHIPFMCIATNLETGKLKIFEEGDISESVLASSAFPSLMDPVKVGDSIYIDGAMSINYPSEPLKNKGMDIVIGVNLNQGLNKREKINSIIDIFSQIADFGIVKETQNQINFTDVNIHPNLQDLSVSNFEDKQKIIQLGYEETLKYVDFLKSLPKKNGENPRPPINPIYSNLYTIDEFELANNKIYDTSYVLGKMGLKIPSDVTYEGVNKMVDKLYATQEYKTIRYEIDQENDKNVLKVNVNEDNNRFFLKFGLHYDEVFKSGLLANLTIKRVLFRNSSFSFDGILGDKSRFYLNYLVDNGYIPGFGLYASGMSFDLKNKEGFVQENWKWFRNSAFVQSVWRDKFAIGGGVSYDYFESINAEHLKTTESFLNPYFFIKGDNQDSNSFPKKGFYTEIEGKMYNVFTHTSTMRAFQINANVKINIPITKWLSYRIGSYYGISINPVPDFYKYHLGGIFEQKVGNFVRFNGYEFGQERNNNVIQLSNSLQFNAYKNYYFIANLNLANLFSDFKDAYFLKVSYSSVGVTAGYDSPFGQIKINYSHALNNHPGIFSIILGHWF